jgi:sporulation protein YlmC with PRC-barrel domain
MPHDNPNTGLTGDRARRTSEGELAHLSDLKDFNIPKGEPDPRGWDVKTADGVKIGKVDDLLVDTGLGRLRYLEVKLKGDIADRADKEYMLIPIGAAQLDDDEDDVIISVDQAKLAGIPAYDRQRMSRDYERSLRTYYEGAAPDRAPGGAAEREADFYAHPQFDERTFFGGRRKGREDRPYLTRGD